MDPHDTPSQFSHGVPTNPTSRRKFLKAAVVGGAAVAAGAASGAAGVVIAQHSGSAPRITNLFNVGNPGVSGNDPYKFTFEPTEQNVNLTSIGKTGPSQTGGPYNLNSAYFAVLAMYLTSGYYTVLFQQSLDNTNFSTVTSGDSPFTLASGGNAALVYFTTGTLNDGPYAKPATGQISPSPSDSFPVDIHTTSSGNILAFAHLKYNGDTPSASGTKVYFQFVVTPTDSSYNPTGSPTTVSFTLTVYPDS